MKEVGKQFRVSYRSVQTILTKRLSQLPVEALFWGSKMVPAAARVGQLFQKGENDPFIRTWSSEGISGTTGWFTDSPDKTNPLTKTEQNRNKRI